MKHKKIFYIALATGLILLVPLITMQFVDEIVWNLLDFVVAGMLLFGAGLTYELITRKVHSIEHRSVIGILLIAVLFLVWAELSVGIYGTPFAGQ